MPFAIKHVEEPVSRGAVALLSRRVQQWHGTCGVTIRTHSLKQAVRYHELGSSVPCIAKEWVTHATRI